MFHIVYNANTVSLSFFDTMPSSGALQEVSDLYSLSEGKWLVGARHSAEWMPVPTKQHAFSFALFFFFLFVCFLKKKTCNSRDNANEQILQPGKTGMKHKMKIRFFRELSDGVVGGGVGLLMSLSSSLHLTLICILASVLQPYWLTLQCRIDLLLGLKELGVKFHALAFSIREKLENPPPWGHASKSYGPWML